MHAIEPYFRWRDEYITSEDSYSPFYGREYSEFYFDNKVYNYYIHPQWDEFGSETLYLKILYANYDENYAIIELIGEWNDTLYNDFEIMMVQVLHTLLEFGIYKYIFIGENVFNFHGSDDLYYEEFADSLEEKEGWMCFINFLDHVKQEMEDHDIQQHVYLGGSFDNLAWRPMKPQHFYKEIEQKIEDFESSIFLLE